MSSAIHGRCHCGAVGFELRQRPAYITKCNCSICRRYAPLWVHSYRTEGMVLHVPEGATDSYIWGDGDLAFHRCKKCGCMTHWQSRRDERFAVNLGMADPDDITDIRIRHFDGADSWEFLD